MIPLKARLLAALRTTPLGQWTGLDMLKREMNALEFLQAWNSGGLDREGLDRLRRLRHAIKMREDFPNEVQK